MQARKRRRWFLAAGVLASSWIGAPGCAQILGLDETRELAEEPPGGGAGGAGQGGEGGAAGGLPAYVQAVLDDAPVAYFRLDDAAAPVVDAVDVGLTGQGLGDLTLGVPGAVGTALELSGAAGEGGLSLGDVFDFTGTGPMSIELWMRADDASEFQLLVDKRSDTPYAGYSISIEPDAPAKLKFSRAEGGQLRNVAVSIGAYVGALTYVVATFDGSVSRLYMNGVPIEPTTAAGDVSVPNTSEPLVIGSGGTFGYFDGVIDEVALYDTALTLEQIQAHFEAAGS